MKVCRYVAGAGEQCAEAERKAASTVQYSTARVTLPLSRTSGGRQELAILSGALAGNPRRAPRCCCWVQLSARYLAPRTALLRNTPHRGPAMDQTHSREDLEGKISSIASVDIVSVSEQHVLATSGLGCLVSAPLPSCHAQTAASSYSSCRGN